MRRSLKLSARASLSSERGSTFFALIIIGLIVFSFMMVSASINFMTPVDQSSESGIPDVQEITSTPEATSSGILEVNNFQ